MKIKLIKTIFSHIGFSLLILSFFFCPAKVTGNSENNLHKKPLLDELIILSTIGNIPDETSKIVKYQDKVDLFAVVKDREKNYYLGNDDSISDKITIDGKIYSIEDGTLKRWNKIAWGELSIKWHKIMPKMKPSHPRSEYEWYSNVFTEGPKEGEFAEYVVIEYTQSSLDETGWSIRLKNEIGTARFRAEVNYDGKLLSSPGQLDPLHPTYIVAEDYYKGIKPSVHCISRTSNNENKLIRYIEALRGVPWLWGADYKTGDNDPQKQQSELPSAIGIECADLIISALRAMGNDKLKYIKANRFAQGEYTVPLVEGRTFQFAINDIFRGWIPRGIAFQQDRFYVCGRGSIKIFNNSFELTTVIEDTQEPLSNYLDIALSSQDDLIYLINDSFNRRIEILDQDGNLIRYFSPKIEQVLEMGDQSYSQQMELRPTGIGIDENKDIYLLRSDSVYIFNQQGEKKGEIKLEGLYEPFVPTGPLAVNNDRIYIPAYQNYILVYNLQGNMVAQEKLTCTPIGLDIEDERYYYFLLIGPLRIEARDSSLTFLADSYDRLIDQEGNDIIISIGTGENTLRVGDIIMSRGEEEEEFSHTLILYEDSNRNGSLDFNDKLIFAGHEGVMIETVKEKLGRRNFSLRRLDESIVKIK
ncbi:MAG: hypothetical protein GH144_09745 [Clostridia bacterium]|nr:hypothetical protein [Clostridia bacterium]